MGLRPRTPLVKARKARRCVKCGKKLNSQVKRCKACHALAPLPSPNRQKKKLAFRRKKAKKISRLKA